MFGIPVGGMAFSAPSQSIPDNKKATRRWPVGLSGFKPGNLSHVVAGIGRLDAGHG